jgi:hypothetical protein
MLGVKPTNPSFEYRRDSLAEFDPVELDHYEEETDPKKVSKDDVVSNFEILLIHNPHLPNLPSHGYTMEDYQRLNEDYGKASESPSVEKPGIISSAGRLAMNGLVKAGANLAITVGFGVRHSLRENPS